MSTKYEFNDKRKPLVCQALTFGYLYDMEAGLIEDVNLSLAIMDSTGIDMEAFRALRRNEIPEIWEIIKKETYPELYDANGKEIELPDEDNNKKKV